MFCLYLDVFRSDLGREETRAWGGQNQGACLDCKRPLKPLKSMLLRNTCMCVRVCVCISEEKEFVSTPAPAQCEEPLNSRLQELTWPQFPLDALVVDGIEASGEEL